MERFYSVSHEWVAIEGTVATVGISDHAQSTLGDIVFADLPKTGITFGAGDEAVVIESMKAASPVHAPISGTVTEINSALVKKPETINSDPLGEGWLFKMNGINSAETDKLMSESIYLEYIQNQ